MATRPIVPGSVVAALLWLLAPRQANGQAPTIQTGAVGQPGSTVSRLGPSPGAGASPFGFLPGAGEMILGGGQPGPSFPRVPASISTPAIGAVSTARPRGIAAPQPLPIAHLAIYGTLALPRGNEDEGPSDGLTLDQVIERLVHDNLDLQSKSFEIPQARADVLTAGLRANPIFYADSQLVPYGKYGRNRAGGPTQYDVNISHPLDLSRKHQARTLAAERALSVLEAQYQNVVRLQVNNLYTAYVDVLAARETLRFAQASSEGLDRVLEVSEVLHRRSTLLRPDLERVKMQKEAAEVGVEEARQFVQNAKRSLAALLSIAPNQADGLEVRGTIAARTLPIAEPDELVRHALEQRPDLIAQRLSIQSAQAGVRVARAERFSDVYLLYQPYTFQNLAPSGLLSATSWALGVTVPLPIYNRNQGGMLRADLGITHAQIDTAATERQIANEVTQAVHEYLVSGALVKHFEESVLPTARLMLDDGLQLFQSGERDAFAYFNVQRDYNQTVRRYRDALVRHRRSMLALNTAVGQRVLP